MPLTSAGNLSGFAAEVETRGIEGTREERAIAHEKQMAGFPRSIRDICRAEARRENPNRGRFR